MHLIKVGEKFWQWLSGILLILGAIYLFPHGDFRQPEAVLQFWLGIGVMSGGFILSWLLRSVTVWCFWSIAILTRLFLLPMYPGDDVWRYLWEGYIQTLGFSPYDFAPNAVDLIPYRTEWWSLINHQGVSAIYPPITQLGFRSLALITPHLILFKIAFVIADLLVCWLLTRRFSYSQSILYAWNPLVIYSFAGGAHYDSWFILPLVAAWFLWESREEKQKKPIFVWLGTAFLIGVATAVKWISLPILGFIVWRAWRKVSLILSFVVVIGGILPLFLTALPFCRLDSCPLIPTSSTFVSHGRSAELIPYLLSKVWQPAAQSNAIFALPLGIAVLFLLRKTSFRAFSEGYFFSLLTLSPIIHAWYFTWIITFAVATQNWGVRLLSISAFIYFALPYRQALGINTWYLNDTERLWLWLPFIVGYLGTFGRKPDSSKLT
ncbi:MAG: glycosyl transferase family 2 [Xenococcaceae cyanobacterium]